MYACIYKAIETVRKNWQLQTHRYTHKQTENNLKTIKNKI